MATGGGEAGVATGGVGVGGGAAATGGGEVTAGGGEETTGGGDETGGGVEAGVVGGGEAVGVVGVGGAGVEVGEVAGDCPPTTAKTMQIEAKRNASLGAIGSKMRGVQCYLAQCGGA